MRRIVRCDRCGWGSPQPIDVMRDLVDSPGRSVDDITRHIHAHDALLGEAREQADRRLAERPALLEDCERRLKEYEEELALEAAERLLKGEDAEQVAERIISDSTRRELEQAANSLRYQPEDIDDRDVEAVLERYRQQGYLDIEGGRVKITSRGARLLAERALAAVLEGLSGRDLGTHVTEEVGFGAELSTRSRPYQVGDEYASADIEKTLLNALERGGAIDGGLRASDFRVFESQHQSKICAGVIVDVSSSMRSGGKLGAAVEAALALATLVGQDPKDRLRTFAFSEKVRQVAPWGMVNEETSGGSTDIRAAMRAFRVLTRNETGDKQAYLITDAEPNTEDGDYVGFERAMVGVLQEAMRYREAGITLNVIMLGRNAVLKEFARTVARRNLGRVVFATAGDLGKAMIEDYLKAKSATGRR